MRCRRPTTDRPNPHSRRLQVEPLEDRRMLSTITVNTLVDENNGIGVGGISLRDAIAAATPGDTIDFSVTGTIVLTNGQLLVGKSLTIQGPGANLLTISRTGPQSVDTRLFLIGAAATIDVELIGLSITGGSLHGMGGAIGGAILNSENLTVRACVISGNESVVGGFSTGQGGGIASSTGNLVVIDSTISGNSSDRGGGIDVLSGSLTVTNSTISNNTVTFYGGGGIWANGPITVTGSTIADNTAGVGPSAFGGGISASGTGMVTVTGSTLRDNTAGSGGGIYRANGSLNVTGSTIEDNDATNGGGIFASATLLAVNRSLLSGNTATSQGGGIYGVNGQLTVTESTLSGNAASYGGGLLGRSNTMTIDRSTISGNMSPHSNGGGIESVFATLNVFSSTVSGNTSGAGGGILSYFSTSTINHSTITGNYGSFLGGGINVTGGTLTLNDSIVAGNTGVGSTRDDISGSASANYSLIGDDTGATLTGVGNQIGSSMMPINPLLGLLAGNGGPTFTHALQAGSPAIDAGDPNFISPPDYDQRGFAYQRVVGGLIDIGAFELGATSADFDEDGDVDGLDFLAWQIGFGTAAPNAVKGDGDADNDLDVDADDLAAWENAYGAGGGAPLVGNVVSTAVGDGTTDAGSVLSARLVDLALADDGTDEKEGTYVEMAGEVVAGELRERVVVRPSAGAGGVADFGDIVVSRPAADGRSQNKSGPGAAWIGSIL